MAVYHSILWKHPSLWFSVQKQFEMVTSFIFPLLFRLTSLSLLFVSAASASFLNNLFWLCLLHSVALSPQGTLCTSSTSDLWKERTSSSRDLCTLEGLLWWCVYYRKTWSWSCSLVEKQRKNSKCQMEGNSLEWCMGAWWKAVSLHKSSGLCTVKEKALIIEILTDAAL